uniref:Uncharacterized protein n=1 Tax=Cannabis sativa TaxID=3483 RepID=A0A803QEW0_CANSA
MANVTQDENLTLTQIEETTKELSLHLKKSIQNVDLKFQQLNHSIHHHLHHSIVSEFLTLKKDQMLHQQEFDKMESLKFKILKDLSLNRSMFFLVKREMQRLKKEEENLNQKLIQTLGNEDFRVVESRDGDLEGVKKREDDAVSFDEELKNSCLINCLKEEEEDVQTSVEIVKNDAISRSFSMKFKLIKYYYQQPMFNWIRDGKDERFEEEVSVCSKEIKVRNKYELEFKIHEFLEARREAMKKARVEGKFSYIEWADHAMSSNRFTEIIISIQEKVEEISRRLCVQICELMFASAENLKQFRQWHNFKQIFMLLMILQEPGETVYLGRMASVLEAAQHILMRTKQYKFCEESEGLSSEIGGIFDLFLREVLCFESILTYPIFSPVFDDNTMLVNVEKILDECLKQEFGYNGRKDGGSLVTSMIILVNREIERLMKAKEKLNKRLSALTSNCTEDGSSSHIQSQGSTRVRADVKEEEKDLGSLDGSSSNTDSQVVRLQELTSERVDVTEEEKDSSELEFSSSNTDSQVLQVQETTGEGAGVAEEEKDLSALEFSSSSKDSQVVQVQESTSERADVKDDGNTSSENSQAAQPEELIIERANSFKDEHKVLKKEKDHDVCPKIIKSKRYSSSLSRKLKLIKHYYLARNTKFNWLRNGKDDKFEIESATDSEEFRVRNMSEMEKKIAVLIEERQKAIEYAQKEGKRSYLKWFELHSRTNHKRVNKITLRKCQWIYQNAIYLHDKLIHQMCELIFTFEICGQVRKWNDLKHILLLLLLLQEQDETGFFCHFVILATERAQTLVEIKMQQHGICSVELEGMSSRIDEFMDLFLREFLCLESMFGYPILYSTHVNSKLDAIKIGVEECMKQMNEIQNKVTEFMSLAIELGENVV